MQNDKNNWDNLNFGKFNLDSMSDEELKTLFEQLNILTPEDIEELRLLSIQLPGTIIYLIAILVEIQSTEISIKNVLDKKGEYSRPNPDILTIKSQFIFLILRIVFILIALRRINDLTEKIKQGKANYSLKPNYQIALGGLIALIGISLQLVGFIGVYHRNQDVSFI